MVLNAGSSSHMIAEHRGESDLDLAWSSSCSELAEYLTRKGAGVDPGIKWGHVPAVSCEQVHASCGKRSISSEESITLQKRRATVESLSVDIREVKELLEASLAKEFIKNDEKIYMTFGGPRKSVDFLLSMAAEPSRDHSRYSNAPIPMSALYPKWYQEDDDENQLTSSSSPSSNAPMPGFSSHEQIYSNLNSMTSTPTSRAPSMKLTTHSLHDVTVLFIDIKGFTSACAAMPAARVGEWVADFYERVDAVAAAHGVSKIEVRGDCCVCVAGVAGRIPYRAIADPAADPRDDQATRMLAFAAALHADLATLPSSGPAAATTTRMGIASGEVAFLVSDAAAGPDAAPFASVRGDAVDGAARMEALAAAGEALVHKSAADRWAAEGGPSPPATVCVEVKGGGLQRAAVFDCAARAFRPAARAASACSAGGPAATDSLRRASCLF